MPNHHVSRVQVHNKGGRLIWTAVKCVIVLFCHLCWPGKQTTAAILNFVRLDFAKCLQTGPNSVIFSRFLFPAKKRDPGYGRDISENAMERTVKKGGVTVSFNFILLHCMKIQASLKNMLVSYKFDKIHLMRQVGKFFFFKFFMKVCIPDTSILHSTF